MTQDADLQPLVASEFLTLADALAGVSEADWDTQSECEGWRIRELIAHLTMPARYSQDAFLAELRARQFDFGRLSNELAAQDAKLTVASLISDLRLPKLHQWVPPEGGPAGALNHVVVHGLDATVPLGLGRLTPDHAMKIVLDGLTDGGVHRHFGTDLTGRSLETIDLDWSWGSGASLRATAGDLALVLCGRTVPAERLQGPPL